MRVAVARFFCSMNHIIIAFVKAFIMEPTPIYFLYNNMTAQEYSSKEIEISDVTAATVAANDAIRVPGLHNESAM